MSTPRAHLCWVWLGVDALAREGAPPPPRGALCLVSFPARRVIPPPPPAPSGGSVDTTKTRSGPQRVRMSGGERPIGAAKGKQSDAEALCHPPPPPPPFGPPPPPPDQRDRRGGKQKFQKGKFVRPFLVHTLLNPRTPPPLPWPSASLTGGVREGGVFARQKGVAVALGDTKEERGSRLRVCGQCHPRAALPRACSVPCSCPPATFDPTTTSRSYSAHVCVGALTTLVSAPHLWT